MGQVGGEESEKEMFGPFCCGYNVCQRCATHNSRGRFTQECHCIYKSAATCLKTVDLIQIAVYNDDTDTEEIRYICPKCLERGWRAMTMMHHIIRVGDSSRIPRKQMCH